MAMAKASLSLLLITVPVRLDTATQTQQAFKSLCVGQEGKTHDPVAVTAPKRCTTCGPITDYASLKKGLPAGDGFAIFEQSEIAEAKADHDLLYKGKVELLPFHADGFFGTTAQSEKLYVVNPEAATADQYQLIVKAVENHPEWAFVAQYTPRTRAGLYVARVRDGVLLLEERARQENLKALPQPVGAADPNMLTLLDQVLPTTVNDFDPEKYADKYAARIAELAASRGAVEAGAEATTPVAASTTDDLMAQLQKLAAAAAGTTETAA